MVTAFDDAPKEEIRSRADIATIIGRYVKLKPSGQTLKGLCPFHKEKTPSFHVNPSRQFFHCFGCGKGGDVFKFLQEIEGLTFPETLKMLAEETGVALAPLRREQPAQGETTGPSLSKTEMIDIHKLAADFFYSLVRAHQAAIDYFKSRGIAAETVRDFRLGYAPPGWSSLLSFCETRKIPPDSLVACGLAIRKEDGSAYDRFRDRVMFSLFDLSGRIIGFAGRGRDKETVPKYLNSPETPLYRKKEFLYGLNITRQYIKEEKSVLVVEGYMDFLTLYQAGIRNVVATSGTAMTPEHAAILKRFASRVVLVFDGDEAGQTAAERGVYTLAPFDLDVAVLVLPAADDPDSFVKKSGADSFRALIARAREANGFIIDAAILRHDGGKTPRAQKAVIEQIKPLYATMSDSLARARLRRDVSQRMGLDEKTVGKLLGSAAAGGGNDSSSGMDVEMYLRSLEGSFLHILATRPELIAEARQYIAPEILTDGISGNIYSIMLELHNDQGNIDGIIDRATDEEPQRLVSRMLVKPALEEHIHEELVQKIIHLRKKYLKARIRANRIRLAAERDPSQNSELVHQINDDMKQLRDLNEE